MKLFKYYRFNHFRKVLQEGYKHYKTDPKLKDRLIALETAINAKDRALAGSLAKELENDLSLHYKKSWLKSGVELIFALAVALVIAVIIRQTWFELYEIPTGSMRPTFKEQDNLTVSKAQFGINVPLKTEHFLFDPDLVQRTSTIIFTGDKLPFIDSNSPFLGVFPYKKRYVKRLIGKPEDTFYFYGGRLYALDHENKPLDELRNSPWMEKLDYIPFISFEGQAKNKGQDTIIFHYFNIPLAKVNMNPQGELIGEVFDGKKWVQDDVLSHKVPKSSIKTLSDYFGMNNFAMAQIYTKEELKTNEEGVLFLVLRHTPNLDFTKGEKQATAFPKTMTSILALNQEDLKTLMGSMYTARFIVENEKVKRYSHEQLSASSNAPILSGVPDGTYEFYYGKAYQVHFGGITTELSPDHPLYIVSPKRVQQLFNLGTNWDNAYMPNKRGFPTRYAYFRDGDLFVMGAPLLKKENPRLQSFVAAEQKKQENSSSKNPYIAFIDRGAPLNEPSFFQTFGLKIPEKQYLVLGDNHAMSGDSRVFGFVPEENLQGVPDIIFWPPFDRLGRPAQKPYPLFTTPRMIVWAIAAVIGGICYAFHRRKLRKKLEF